MTTPTTCPKHARTPWPGESKECTCPVVYGARHRVTGEWAKRDGETDGERYIGNNPGAVLLWCARGLGYGSWLDTYRIVRIRKVKRRVPSPSKRLAAWCVRSSGRILSIEPLVGGWLAVAVLNDGHSRMRWEKSSPTIQGVLRALRIHMGKAIDE